MNVLSPPSVDHTYANTKRPAPSTPGSFTMANVNPSPSIMMETYNEDADETLKADEFDEARNEASLVAVLLRKIFLNQSIYEEEYAMHLAQLECNENEMKQKLTAQSVEMKELREKLAKSEDQVKQMKSQMSNVHTGLCTKLNDMREISYDFYLVMQYALEKFFDQFNKKSEYESSEKLERKFEDGVEINSNFQT